MAFPSLKRAKAGLIGAVFAVSSAAAAQPETVQIKSPDGTFLAAAFSKPVDNRPLVVMLHGLDSSRGEWQPLVNELDKAGWGTLAYDARPHGTPWKKWVDDVGAVVRYAEREKSIPRERIVFVGASVGANVALKYAALTGVGQAVVLLSPGLNYQNVTTDDSVTLVKAPILVVASPADRYAAASSLELKKISPRVELWTDVKPGHGVQMFDPPLLARLLAWLKKQTAHP